MILDGPEDDRLLNIGGEEALRVMSVMDAHGDYDSTGLPRGLRHLEVDSLALTIEAEVEKVSPSRDAMANGHRKSREVLSALAVSAMVKGDAITAGSVRRHLKSSSWLQEKIEAWSLGRFMRGQADQL